MRVCGIMSGTSLDGIDVAIVEVTGKGWKKRLNTLAHATYPYPKPVRSAILAISNRETHTGQIARIHVLLGELYAEAVLRLCRESSLPPDSVELIGCHGQTVFHEGQGSRVLGRQIASTLQIGEAAVIAERTGTVVASNFRARDMAAGGKGAPLVPYVDYLLFRDARRGRVALNIGGIANLTVIPPAAQPEQVIAFDTGPGNMVMDQLVSRLTNGRQVYDRGGRLAAKGTVNEKLVKELCNDRFFRQAPPKTAGREEYGSEMVDRLVATGLPLTDLIATANAFTAETIAIAVRRFAEPLSPVDDVIVSGGGAHNPVLMASLAQRLPGSRVRPSSDFGMNVDAKEAIAFAILAYETFHHRPANLPSATGASRPVVLGSLTY